MVELSFDGGVPSRGDNDDDGNDATDYGNDDDGKVDDVGGNYDGNDDDVGGLGSQSFSELCLTGESSAGIYNFSTPFYVANDLYLSVLQQLGQQQ